MTTQTQTPVDTLLDQLARFESTEFPVLSLYLDARPSEVGRDDFGTFLRKELHRRLESYPARSAERESIEADAEKIRGLLGNGIDPSINTLAIFACSAAGLFETIELDAALGESRLFVAGQPHLYPLARLADQARSYAALIADTNSARIVVFGLGREQSSDQVENPKTRRSKAGGMSQMRYQRHIDHTHLRHVKETVEHLARVVREEAIEHVILVGNVAVLPLLREQLPKDVAERVIDSLSLEAHAPEHELLEATLEAFRQHDAATDAEAVARLVDEVRAGGLAVAGSADCLSALESGQVDQRLLAAEPLGSDRDPSDSAAALSPEELAKREALAGDLVARARRTAAAMRFIEDPGLLWGLGGVGAFLRYRLTAQGPVIAPLEVPAPEPLE